MYRKNEGHKQVGLFGIDFIPSRNFMKELEETEEYYFYKTIFLNINEDIFSPLYCSDNGRPNSPINAMVSALILKEKRDWTYEGLLKEIKYNLSTRAAFGLFSFGDMPFNQATLFNFQNRIKDYEEQHNVNLFEKVFDALTAEQLKKLKLKTNIARTDSFMVDSNIRSYGRLQLLIEVLLRLYRVLSDSDKQKFSSHFLSYEEHGSEHYIYELKGSDLPHEYSKITSLYYWVKLNFPERYHSSEEYKIFLRVYDEHFKINDDNKLQMLDSKELDSNSLQSPDDPDVTYRKKCGESHKGQVASITETAHPDNELNLLVDVALASNNTDDSEILNDRLDKIGEKLSDLDELHFDGGYGSEDNDKAMEVKEIMPVQTAVKGRKPEVSMDIDITENGGFEVSCPHGQRVKAGSTRKRYKACFNKAVCHRCPFKKSCPTIEQKKCRVYYFEESEIRRKQRHRNISNLPLDRRKIRANVEATVHEFTHRMRGHKLKVRGAFKASLFVFATAIAINFGRIYRYNVVKTDLTPQNSLIHCVFSVIEKISAYLNPILDGMILNIIPDTSQNILLLKISNEGF